jgi:hypothetical protein
MGAGGKGGKCGDSAEIGGPLNEGVREEREMVSRDRKVRDC